MINQNITQTETVEKIKTAIEFAKISGDISLIYGEAGLGKTVTLKEYAQTHSDVIYVELQNCDKSTRGACERILESMRKEFYGTDRCLVKIIVNEINAKKKLIILDEAQHLSISALENIRAINDRTAAGLVLCGNPTVYDRMYGKGQAHFAQLYSRIGIKLEVKFPSLKEIEMIYKDSVTDQECLKFLHKISLTYGGLRNCDKVVTIAQTFNKDKKEPLNIDALRFADQIRNGNQ